MLTIDRTSDVPIYLQIVNQIKKDVVLGIRRPGDRLPTIDELSKSLSAARPTVGQAFSALQHEGVIETRKLHGSFVQAPSDELILWYARSLLGPTIQDLKRLGLSGSRIEKLFLDIMKVQFVERRPSEAAPSEGQRAQDKTRKKR